MEIDSWITYNDDILTITEEWFYDRTGTIVGGKWDFGWGWQGSGIEFGWD